jgi:hypothetical protein
VANPITQSNPGWSSTDDLLLGVTKSSVPSYGTHYYPNACKQIQGYTSYRVVDELDKVDDSFFEAKVGGLSNSPAVAANGTFLRYEILISPVSYGTIATNQWYLTSVLNSLTQPLSFPCGQQSAGGPHASPADQGIGAITIKNAWMDATGVDTSDFHTEKLLIFTSAEENNGGQDTCELKTMALVGMHIAHKTTEQAGWTWSTFEHQANAPNCLNAPPAPDPNRQNAVGANLACPSAGGSYNFFPQNTGDPATRHRPATRRPGRAATTASAPTCRPTPPPATRASAASCRCRPTTRPPTSRPRPATRPPGSRRCGRTTPSSRRSGSPSSPSR